jgi:hypothetical protein
MPAQSVGCVTLQAFAARALALARERDNVCEIPDDHGYGSPCSANPHLSVIKDLTRN